MTVGSKSLSTTFCLGMLAILGGSTCYTQDTNNPQNACDIVTPPGSPTYPECISRTFNEPVLKVLSVTTGKFWVNPVVSRCGYYVGDIDELGYCHERSPLTFVGSQVVGQQAVGDGCTDPS